MKIHNKIVIIFLLIIFVLPSIASATTEYATFESFYIESSTVGWFLAAGFALIAGAAIIFTGGTASPIVIGFGTWIGNIMGLSGIAATNAGLALLGGGSIASGGFGIIGGTVLLTTALSFGTDVVIDYTVTKVSNEYSYSKLTENSKNMTTLPLPKNDLGSDVYEDAFKLLENIDGSLPLASNVNQKIIRQAINELLPHSSETDEDELVKDNSLLSLFYFVSNDYINSKNYANLAIESARKYEIKRTLPAFIYATSTLYEKSFDFNSITKDYFRYSVLAEPDNPLIPLLFSIYLDRMSLRFNDGFLKEDSLSQVFEIMNAPSLEDYRSSNYTIMLSRYFIRLKLEQQKISSLTTTSSKTIINSKKTLDAVVDSLKSYRVLLDGADNVMTRFLSLELKEEGRAKRSELYELLLKYKKDEKRLVNLADGLRSYQDSLPKDKLISDDGTSSDKSNWKLYILLLILVAFGYFYVKKRT